MTDPKVEIVDGSLRITPPGGGRPFDLRPAHSLGFVLRLLSNLMVLTGMSEAEAIRNADQAAEAAINRKGTRP